MAESQSADSDWAWVAGIIEGEGCFISRNRGTCGSVIVKMGDLDVITRLGGILGSGRLSCERSQNPRHKDMWKWEVARRAEVVAILRRIRPMMGERRAARIDELLPGLETPRCLVEDGWTCGGAPSERGYGLGCRCEGCLTAKAVSRRRYPRG